MRRPGGTWSRGAPCPTRRRRGARRPALACRRRCGAWPRRPSCCGVWAIRSRPCGGVREALALAQTLAHPYSLALAQHWAAWLAYHRREVRGVQAQAEALLRLATT